MTTRRGSDILAFTPTYRRRAAFASRIIPDARATAGTWFDWAWYAGSPDTALTEALRTSLNDPERKGIQYLTIWPENRGQHHATLDALNLARSLGYKWLLRIDDDITFKTSKWLAKMVNRLEELRRLALDRCEAERPKYEPEDFEKLLEQVGRYQLVAAPTINGLIHPIPTVGTLQIGQKYAVDLVSMLGGAVRLHNVEFFSEFEPSLVLPVGRGDPEQVSQYILQRGGMLVRFRDIRVKHDTREIEALDTPVERDVRRMGYYWPYIEVEA